LSSLFKKEHTLVLLLLKLGLMAMAFHKVFPLPNRGASGDHGIVRCKERLGGPLKYYEREAA
jgi:hypothetical protein